MELFLNLLWVLIALTALMVWRCEWKRHECEAPAKPWQQWTAFACALVLLFFVVSLSDDLRIQAFLTDEGAHRRQHSLVVSNSNPHHQGGGQATTPAVLTGNTWSFSLETSARLDAKVSVPVFTVDGNATASRSPPLS